MDEISRLPGPWFDSELDGGIFVVFFGGKGTLRVQWHFFLIDSIVNSISNGDPGGIDDSSARLAAAQSQVGLGSNRHVWS
jgi:hypothetical protein